MGKKSKTGKSRRDKAYWSAKEIGYRSRASFKLIQLNRKFEFLQKSRVCIDLCAAPGSWMQVAKEHMPMSSLIVGVDLAPIKPIPGCIAMINDITTEKCRSDLRKELKTWKADLVLHDGAPNVGKSWVHDAYQQSLLTLSAFKLATEFLMKGGTFVTKVFRSKDYQSLMWVFNQFFKRVHSTKPAASRHESAEIFVVCQNYKAPDKIDPKFLDGKYVFSEIEGALETEDADNELVNPEKKKKKAPAEGYESGVTLLFKQAKASEFIMGDKAIHLLNNCHEIVLDEARIRKHKKTTNEIVECCKDIKVLGMKELRLLKKWREQLRKDFEEMDKKKSKNDADGSQDSDEEEEDEKDSDEDSDEDLKKLEDEIDMLKDEERRAAKRKKKKDQKEKQRRAQKINFEMVIPGDEGPTRQEENLFQLSKAIKNAKDLDKVMDQAPDILAENDDDSDEDVVKRKKFERYDPESGHLDKDGLYYKDDESEEEEEEEEDSDQEDLGLQEEDGSEIDDEEIDKINDPSQNTLLVDLNSQRDRKSRKEMKADVWFDKDVFKGIEDDDDLEEADVEAAIKSIKKKGGKFPEKKKPEPKKKPAKPTQNGTADEAQNEDESSSSESDSDSDFDENEHYPYRQNKKAGKGQNEFEVVPVQKPKKRPLLTPEELALGQELVSSKKRRRELEETAWNRYMFNDADENLPDWFVKEEQYHMRKRPEVDPETVEYYKNRQNDIGVKTIKKVVEAKARKKRKVAKKMDKAKKRAANILENEDLGSREKAREIQRLYKRAASSGKKEDVKYVVAKKATAQKRAKRPAGVKGQYKQVDPRMKKDNNLKRSRATSKRMQKRRLKGKKAKPQQANRR